MPPGSLQQVLHTLFHPFDTGPYHAGELSGDDFFRAHFDTKYTTSWTNYGGAATKHQHGGSTTVGRYDSSSLWNAIDSLFNIASCSSSSKRVTSPVHRRFSTFTSHASGASPFSNTGPFAAEEHQLPRTTKRIAARVKTSRNYKPPSIATVAGTTSFLKATDPRAPTSGSGADFCCSKKLGRCMNKAKCPYGYYKCHNGCMNLKKIAYSQKGAFEREHVTVDQDFHIKSIDTAELPILRHKGQACLPHCFDKTGPCPEFCGNGMCCQKGQAGNYCDGDIGGEDKPVCVMRSVEPSAAPVDHLDQACQSQCGSNGPCPDFCGAGLCCKNGETGNGCDGSMGQMNGSKALRVCVRGRPPADLMPPQGPLFVQGMQAGAEIMVVNKDTKEFRNQDPQVLLKQLNEYNKGEIYIMGPPAKNPRCSDAQNYCNMRGDTLDARFNAPAGCKDHIGCDSDQICCCKKTGRKFPCEVDEYKLPMYNGQPMCALSDFDEQQVQKEMVLGDNGWAGWSDENVAEA
ncbi:unnamed protein product [Amoebophrya sp. A120]|nr:unnamed protein product [Amoebophrya sp. A120]|eukprot:GSA120T00003904001.1